jgi:hypothetical protein
MIRDITIGMGIDIEVCVCNYQYYRAEGLASTKRLSSAQREWQYIRIIKHERGGRFSRKINYWSLFNISRDGSFGR